MAQQKETGDDAKLLVIVDSTWLSIYFAAQKTMEIYLKIYGFLAFKGWNFQVEATGPSFEAMHDE